MNERRLIITGLMSHPKREKRMFRTRTGLFQIFLVPGDDTVEAVEFVLLLMEAVIFAPAFDQLGNDVKNGLQSTCQGRGCTPRGL